MDTFCPEVQVQGGGMSRVTSLVGYDKHYMYWYNNANTTTLRGGAGVFGNSEHVRVSEVLD